MEQEKNETAEAWSRALDPKTSLAAAHSMKGKNASSIAKKVAAAVSNSEDGLTSSQIQQITGIKHESLTPRLAPLRRKGIIADSGKRRLGESGREQIVWVIGNGEHERKKQALPNVGELVAVSHFPDFNENPESVRVGAFKNARNGYHIEGVFLGFAYLKRFRAGTLSI